MKGSLAKEYLKLLHYICNAVACLDVVLWLSRLSPFINHVPIDHAAAEIVACR